MSKITKEEVIKIAALSHIIIEEHKMDALIQQLEDVLNYAERVIEITGDANEKLAKQINIFREDIVMSSDSKQVMKEAPESDQNYFVVPKIL